MFVIQLITNHHSWSSVDKSDIRAMEHFKENPFFHFFFILFWFFSLVWGSICVACSSTCGVWQECIIIFFTCHLSSVNFLIFSQAVIAGNTMYLSGMIGFIPSTMEIVQGGAGPETDQVYASMLYCLLAYWAFSRHCAQWFFWNQQVSLSDILCQIVISD